MKKIAIFFLVFVMICGLSNLALSKEPEPEFSAKKTLMQRIEESPNAIPLYPNNPLKDVQVLFNDFKHNPKRDPGPIDIQRTTGGMHYTGIPTFFKAPVALTPEDLKAGKVDVAIMGAAIDLSTGMRGAAYGPQAVRTAERIGLWGRSLKGHFAHPHVGRIYFQDILSIVDYGDAPVDILSPERSYPAVAKMVREIAKAGVIPVIVGGDHSLSYPNIVAITDVYGKGNVGVVHFDVHFDGEAGFFGHYTSHGSWVKQLIDEQHVKGKNFVQVGLRSSIPGPESVEWMRKNQMRYHMMAEIQAKGWEKVLKDVLAEALDGPEYVYLSIDLDSLEPAYAPGQGTPEPGGLTPLQLFDAVRGVAAATKIVGADVVELNPIVDQTYLSPLIAVRTMGEVLTGIAMRKKGITDPHYRDPHWKNHGVPLGKK